MPDDFRFAVIIPEAITHERRLADVDDLLDRFLSEARGLGPKLGPLLVQLSPSLSFRASIVDLFPCELRSQVSGSIICEPPIPPGHPQVETLLAPFGLPAPAARHGSPRIYHSAYSPEYLAAISKVLARDAATCSVTWCTFENTAAFAAAGNALTTRSLVIAADCSRE